MNYTSQYRKVNLKYIYVTFRAKDICEGYARQGISREIFNLKNDRTKNCRGAYNISYYNISCIYFLLYFKFVSYSKLRVNRGMNFRHYN